MEILKLIDPFPQSFTGNPVRFVFMVHPWDANQAARNLTVQINIQLEDKLGSSAFSTFKTLNMLPMPSGQVEVNLQSLLNAMLRYYLSAAPVVEHADGQSLHFRLQYRLLEAGTHITSTVSTDPYLIIKGGFSAYQWMPNATQVFGHFTANRPLTWNYTDVLTRANEPRWMYFLLRQRNVGESTFSIDVTVQYHDGTDNTFALRTDVAHAYGAVYFVRCGLNEMGLALDAGKTVISYQVSITEDGGTPRTHCSGIGFIVDHRPMYYPRVLVYRNSLGGLDTISITGAWTDSAEYERTELKRVDAGYYFDAKQPLARQMHTNVTGQEKSKGNTGYYSEQRIQHLRDLALTNEAYEWINNRLIPIQILNRSVAFNSAGQPLYSLEIEWQVADRSQYYTPDGVYTDPGCAAARFFAVKQISENKMRFVWALPPGHERGYIEYDYGTGPYVLQLYTNHGSAEVDFVNPNIPSGSDPVNSTIYTICNPYSTPQVESAPWLESFIPVGNMPPVALGDTYDMAGGYTSKVLGNVLDNDYDPEGQTLEAVAVTGGATTAGGTIDISAAGVVTYYPPSTSFSGTDTYTYTVREVAAPSSSSTGLITINVASVPTGSSTYVRLRTVWISETTNEDGVIYTRKAVYLDYFSDVSGTSPKNMTGLGVSIMVDKTTYNSNTEVTNTLSQTFTAAGTQQEIFYGDTYVNFAGVYYIETTFDIQPGTGYTEI